jgi:hypothetical protein
MAWQKIDPTARQTYWDENKYEAGTIWDEGGTIWDLTPVIIDNWTKQEPNNNG